MGLALNLRARLACNSGFEDDDVDNDIRYIHLGGAVCESRHSRVSRFPAQPSHLVALPKIKIQEFGRKPGGVALLSRKEKKKKKRGVTSGTSPRF